MRLRGPLQMILDFVLLHFNGTTFSTSSGTFPHEIEERRGFQRASLWTLCAPGHNFDLAPIELETNLLKRAEAIVDRFPASKVG